MEVALAARSGLGWRGKHTLLLSRDAGSLFFLGELFVGLDLARDAPVSAHCGTCERCIEVCPTRAIVAPYQLDARRCISYLTIEHHGAIPEELRPLIGNHIYGCDDCQLVCPWNKYARTSPLPDFAPRNGLDAAALVDLFAWTVEEFDRRLEGSAIRRIGHERWLRNIATALGNAPTTPAVVAALRSRSDHPSALVRDHVAWALGRHVVTPGGAIAPMARGPI
jgi:epoxyqueuosine reductase